MSSSIVLAIIQTVLLVIFFIYQKTHYSWLTDGFAELLALIATSIVYICMRVCNIYHVGLGINLCLFFVVNLSFFYLGIGPNLIEETWYHEMECHKKLNSVGIELDKFENKTRQEQLDFLVEKGLIRNSKDLKWWEPVLKKKKEKIADEKAI